jgi:hypothetical protein
MARPVKIVAAELKTTHELHKQLTDLANDLQQQIARGDAGLRAELASDLATVLAARDKLTGERRKLLQELS